MQTYHFIISAQGEDCFDCFGGWPLNVLLSWMDRVSGAVQTGEQTWNVGPYSYRIEEDGI